MTIVCFMQMSTALRVRLAHGAWDRNDDGHWTFQRKPTALGYTVLIKPTETLEDLETIIRDRFKLYPDTPLVMAYTLQNGCLNLREHAPHRLH